MNDVRYALRMLGKHPIANMAIVLTIGLLVAAISTLYAGLRASQLAEMPFPKPEQVVRFWRTSANRTDGHLPADVFMELRHHVQSFAELGALNPGGSFTLTGFGEPESVQTMNATASVLRLTGLPPHRGRYFSDDEERGDAPVAVISYGFWQKKFSGDDSVLGQVIRLNNRSVTVIGVMPPEMDRASLNASRAPFWKPHEYRPWTAEQNGPPRYASVEVVGRLRDGITIAQAQTEVSALSAEIERQRARPWWEQREVPGGYTGALVKPLNKIMIVDARMQRELIAMWTFISGVALCVMLIACSNVTNLLLVRVGSRAREMAIRSSLGAARGRLVRQLLFESGALGLLGGFAGLLMAVWIMALLRSQHLDPRFDLRLFGIGLAVAVLLGFAVGILPALRGSSCDLTRALKDGGQTTGGRHRHRLRNVLVAAQVAMALVLCVAAGLLTRAFFIQRAIQPGFNPERMLMVNLNLRDDTYGAKEDQIAYVDRAWKMLEVMPGLKQVAFAAPGAVFSWNWRTVLPLEPAPGQQPTSVNATLLYVSPNFHHAMGLTVIRGRELSPDHSLVEPEALVTQLFAERHLAGLQAIGKRLRLSDRPDAPWVTVVGIVKDRPALAQFEQQEPSKGEVHVSFRHGTMGRQYQFFVTTTAAAEPMAKPVREALRSLDENQPVALPNTVAAELARDRQGGRNVMILFSSLAGCGLFLALLGLYGVVSYTVVERTHEIGIRMALGANQRKILFWLLTQGFRLTAFGLLPGLLIAFAITRGLPKIVLGGLSAIDALTYTSVIVLVATTGFLASFLPARRAARVDPMEALRHD